VAVVIWTSYHTWWEAVEGGFRSPTALRAPLSVAYAILPLGMLLVLFQYLAFVFEGIEVLLSGEDPEKGAALLGQGNAELAAAVEESDADPDTVGRTGSSLHADMSTGTDNAGTNDEGHGR
jgi:hypothetical protein